MNPRDVERTRLVRGYILGTLSAADHADVERLVEHSDEWRETLESQRKAIAALQSVSAESPPPDLAASAVRRAIEADVEVRRVNRRSGFPWVPVLASAVVVCVVVSVVLPLFSRAREASRRASNQNNLKQLGIVFKMYADESKGEKYPPIAPYPDVWMFDIRSVYPEYLTDLAVLVNPELPEAEKLTEELNELAAKKPVDWERITRIAARSYTYTAWAIQDASELKPLAEARRGLDAAQLDGDIHVGGKTFYRLKDGIERFFITDINNPASSSEYQSLLPVVFDTSPRARPSGGSILYLDGHVAFEMDHPDIPSLLK